MLLALALAMLVVAAMLLVLGLRGRAINDHPTCARCSFDLIGLASPSTCPECGTSLDKARAIRAGARRKRPALIVTGAATLALLALTVGTFLSGDRLIPYAPSWVLVLETRYAPSKRVPAIVSELLARSAASKLSQSARAGLAQRAFEVQADPALPWEREWASVLTDPSFASTLTTEQREAVSLTGVNADIPYRRRIREGQKLPMEVNLPVGERFLGPGVRSGSITTIHLTIRDSLGHIVADVEQSEKSGLPTAVGGWSAIGVEPVLSLPPGDYQLEAICPMTFAASDGNGTATKAVRVQGPLTIIPRDQPTVEMVHEPEGQKLLLDNLTISGVIRSGSKGRRNLSLQVAMSNAGFDPGGPLVAWELKNHVTLFSMAYLSPLDGSEPERSARRAVPLMYTQKGWSLGGPVFGVGDDFVPGRYRLRLSPDISAAEASLDVERILGGEIIMEIDVVQEAQRQAVPTQPRK